MAEPFTLNSEELSSSCGKISNPSLNQSVGDDGGAAQTRKSSLIQGLGGERKKSVVMPQILDEDENDDNEDMDRRGTSASEYGRRCSLYLREALPKFDNYKSSQGSRPTIEELRSESVCRKNDNAGAENVKEGSIKFGWIEGVLVRCLLNIWGVMLFLRLSWVTAQAGIGLAIVIICVSALLTILTALSMSAISTNGQVKGGGIYYMVSRALGPEFGGAVGAIFSFANATAVAMHTVGFAESLNDLLKTLDVKIIDNGQNDIRIVGTIALVVMQCIILIGTEWESKAQIVLLFILLAAIGDFLLGAFMGPLDTEEISKGFLGLNATLFYENFGPDYRKSESGVMHSFFSIFSIFFPAATGIAAGANISGDLKDPSQAIPIGTLLAIALTTLSYIIFALLAGSATVRDATGPVGNLTSEMVKNWEFLKCDSNHIDCKWGSQNSFQVMELMSVFGPIIYAGCFAATLSSALACLVSAPKVFQALCKDNLFPGTKALSRGFRKNNDPFYCYGVAFIVALGFILIADLNAIAPLIANFFMATYTVVNFCVIHAETVKPLGWRPGFKYYSRWTALAGLILSVTIMFLMSWITALITFAVMAVLAFLLNYKKPDVNWGSSAQAQTFQTALTSVQVLNNTKDHIKTYRPQILVLCGSPSSRPTLVDFCNLITKNTSIMVCGHIIQQRQPYKIREYFQEKSNNWLRNRKIKGFYVLVDHVDFEEGARCLMQSTGIGKLRPNMVLVGFKSDWTTCNSEDLKAYFRVIHDALDNHLGFAMLRLREGLDYSNIIGEESEDSVNDLTQNDSIHSGSELEWPSTESATGENQGHVNLTFQMDTEANGDKSKKKLTRNNFNIVRGPDGVVLPKTVLNNLTQFKVKQRKGTIDIWWMYDDGGLTMLLPHIISTRSTFSACKIRVFALANKQYDLEKEQAALKSLLSKFRIKVSDLTIITGITDKAQEKSKKFFATLVEEYRQTNRNNPDEEMLIEDSELQVKKESTNRHLRLRELLQDHSRTASLIVMTLPIPRRGGVSGPLYMAWLESLTRDMPPFLLVRGNQSSVLTYES